MSDRQSTNLYPLPIGSTGITDQPLPRALTGPEWETIHRVNFEMTADLFGVPSVYITMLLGGAVRGASTLSDASEVRMRTTINSWRSHIEQALNEIYNLSFPDNGTFNDPVKITLSKYFRTEYMQMKQRALDGILIQFLTF